MLTNTSHKIAVYVAFVLATAWLLYSSSQITYSSVQRYSEATKNHGTSSYSVQEREQPEEALAHYTWWLTAFTGVLAFATIGLGAATLWLCLAGERQFKLARNDFEASHRPRMRLKHIWLATSDGERYFGQLEPNAPITVRLDIVNNGDMIAYVRTLNYVTLLNKGERLPQRPPYNEPGARQRGLNDVEIVIGQTLSVPMNDGRVLSNEETTQIQNGLVRLYFIGTVEYWWGIDRNNLRQTAFCRFFTGRSGRFQVDADPDYEYAD